MAEKALAQAAEKAGVSLKDIEYVVVTGKGREFVPFATMKIPETSCLAKGINAVLPSVATLLDMGAEKTLAVRCRQGRPMQMVTNDKCASGNGRFLEMASSILGIGLGEMGEVAMGSSGFLRCQPV